MRGGPGEGGRGGGEVQRIKEEGTGGAAFQVESDILASRMRCR